MSRSGIIFGRGLNGFALCAFALAVSAPLRAADPTLEVKNFTRSTSSTTKAYLKVNAHIVVGCLDSTKTYVLNLPNSTQKSISNTTHYETSVTINARPTINASSFAGIQPLTSTGISDATFAASLSGYDFQQIQVKATGSVNNVAGGPTEGYDFGTIDLIFSLKPGGPGSGKARIPQVLVPDDPEDEGEEVDWISDLTDYYIEPGTNRILPMDIPGVTIGEGNFTPGPGISWNRVRVPSGNVPSSGIPAWIGTPYPRTIPITGGQGGRKTYFTTNHTSDGIAQTWDVGTINTGPDGNTFLNVYKGEIDSQNYGFPPGYKPASKDLMPPKDPGPDTTNVDPCFALGMTWLGLPPPGVTPGGPEPLPPGVTPGDELPAAPGLPGGPPGTPALPGGVDPGVPGAGTPGGGDPGGGSGGGGINLPSIPGPKDPSGGGGSSVGPPKGGDEGDAPSEPGGPLPGPDEVGKETRGIVKELRATLDKIQAKAQGFRQWGKVTAPGAGVSGNWTVYMPIGGGQAVMMTIPTEHASTVRGLLKILLTAVALVAIVDLLLR